MVSVRIECGSVLAGRYRIDERLGSGGMGSVWSGWDLCLQRRVAVKHAVASPASGGGTGQARRRLRREAAALAALTEPGIACLYDLIEADEDVCLVMELVEGQSLAARLDRGARLSVGEALEIVEQCARALEAAHRRGIVHRDVKPSNIMVGEGGVKIVDFGIAAHVDPDPLHADTTQTMMSAVVGTAAYFAPERAEGGPAGPAADFYALGVVLYQMLAGHQPYQASSTLGMLFAHVSATPAPLPPDVPAPVADLCMRLLDKRPQERPARAAQIAAVRHEMDARSSTSGGPLAARLRPLARSAILSGSAAAVLATAAWVLLAVQGESGAAASSPTAPALGSQVLVNPSPSAVPGSAAPVRASSAPATPPPRSVQLEVPGPGETHGPNGRGRRGGEGEGPGPRLPDLGHGSHGPGPGHGPQGPAPEHGPQGPVHGHGR